MPTSLDNTAPVLEADRRFARLAITWFSVDPLQVERILHAVQERQADGEYADFLTAAVEARLLSRQQADGLRLDHAPTQTFLMPAAEFAAESAPDDQA